MKESLKRKIKADNHCLDCKILISPISKRCVNCSNKINTKEDIRNEKISLKNKGRTFSEETKRKMSETRKQLIKEGKIKKGLFTKGHQYGFKKNHTPWSKGLTKETDERINNMSNSRKGTIVGWNHTGVHPNLGKKRSEEFKRKISLINKGRKFSEEHKEKISNFQKNKIQHQLKKYEFKKEDIRLLKENNPNWNGGSSFEPYGLGFNKKFKESIRDRDNHVCMLCNKHQDELKRILDIHHIDYIKINNFPQNCISLCNSCHALTNLNRNIWTTHFQSLMKELYQYKYTQDQKIILDLF